MDKRCIKNGICKFAKPAHGLKEDWKFCTNKNVIELSWNDTIYGSDKSGKSFVPKEEWIPSCMLAQSVQYGECTYKECN